MVMHPAPIVLTREEHMRHIESYWRQKDADRLMDEVLFEEDERQVASALYEPEWPSEKRPAHILAAAALNCLFWVPVIVIALEILRP